MNTNQILDRRFFLIIAGLGVSGLSISRCFANPVKRKPNIVIIHSDDQGAGDVSCYKHYLPINTPNMDKLAKEGIRMTNAYSCGTVCSPSRAGLYTGRYPQRFGYYDNWEVQVGMPDKEMLIGEIFQKAGYKTAMLGKWHLGDKSNQHPLKRGFDSFYGFIGGQHDYFDSNKGETWDGGGEDFAPIFDGTTPVKSAKYLTYEFTERALNYIDKNQKEPFFLLLNYNAPHMPPQVPKDVLKNYDDPNTIRSKTRANIELLDKCVGQIVEKINLLGLREDTLIIFLSDNGGDPRCGHHNWRLRDRKGRLWEGGIRIPMIASWSGKLPENKVYEPMVMNFDVFSTVLAAAGLKPPQDRDIDSVNLIPYWKNENKSIPHEVLFWSYPYEQKRFAVRKGNWKLLSSEDPDRVYALYNLEKDHAEQRNLLKDWFIEHCPENTKFEKELRHLYENWIKQMKPSLVTKDNIRPRQEK